MSVVGWLLSCVGLGSTPPIEPAPAPDPVQARHDAISARLDATYGAGGMGWASNSGAFGAGLLEYVHLFVVAEPVPHYVYVSRGLHRWEHSHEIVMRIAVPAGEPNPRFEAAPLWPVQVIAAFAGVTERTGRAMRFGEQLRRLEIEGLPFRHVVVLRDRGLAPIELGADYVAFLQLYPLDDAEQAALDAIPAGGEMTLLKDRAAADPLMIR